MNTLRPLGVDHSHRPILDANFDEPLSIAQTQSAETVGTTVVFIDEQIEATANAIASLDADYIYEIGSNGDGIEQVSNILCQFKDLDNVHILSHGRDGGLKLGTSDLSSDSIAEYSQNIQDWGDSLTENADLLFHQLILLQARGFRLNDVLRVLQDRHNSR